MWRVPWASDRGHLKHSNRLGPTGAVRVWKPDDGADPRRFCARTGVRRYLPRTLLISGNVEIIEAD